jgi:hypothetical protein
VRAGLLGIIIIIIIITIIIITTIIISGNTQFKAVLICT